MLAACRSARSSWQLLSWRAAWEGNRTWDRFLVLAREPGEKRLGVTMNYGLNQGQCLVTLPFTNLPGKQYLLLDHGFLLCAHERAGRLDS